MKKRTNKSAFEKWWSESRNGLGPRLGEFSPYEVARIAFSAGRQSVPQPRRLQAACERLLEMLQAFDAGFDGFGEVNEVERILGRPLSRPR